MIVGVDIDSYKATICAVPFSGGRPILTEARWRPDGKSGDALGVLGQVPAGMVRALTILEYDSDRFKVEPNVWFVERGFGASRRSDFIVGAFTGAVVATLTSLRAWPPDVTNDPINLMDAAEWKREVTGVSGIGVTKKGTGNGNVKKEIANDACRALLLLDEIEPVDWTPDQLDAWGIAFAGRRINARAAAA